MHALALLLACAGSPDKPADTSPVVDTVPAVDDTDLPDAVDTDIVDTDIVDTDPVDTDIVDTDTDTIDTTAPVDTAVDTALGPDADQDLVPDAIDLCPDLDDRVDLNHDRIADCAQTVAPNSQLTADVVDWEAETEGGRVVRTAWDPGDASGWAMSGALEVTNETRSNRRLESGIRSACLQVPPGEQIDLWFHYLVPAGQMPNLTLDISVIAFSDANCRTPNAQVDVVIPQPRTVIGSWQEMTRGAPIPPAGPSAQVRIALMKPPNTGRAKFLLDDLLVLVHP